MANKIAPAALPEKPRLRSPIELRIQGEDVFLSGRFHRWQATVSLGSNLDHLAAQIAVDATSPDDLTARAHEPEGDLFSFHGKSVVPVGDNAYRAEGRLVTSAGDFPLELGSRSPVVTRRSS